jgi:hypothetical protein
MLAHLLTLMIGGSLGALIMAIIQVNRSPTEPPSSDDNFTGEQL